jgi:hypothetical protein
MLAMGWHGGLGTYNGVVLYTLLGLPLMGLLVWLRPRLLVDVGLIYGTVPWVWMTLIPGDQPGLFPGRTVLVPFHDLVSMGTLGIVGNLLVFAALGFFGPLRFERLASVKQVMVLAACCSASIEVAQFVLCLDRVTSVDDVMLNTTGAGLAALASRRWWLGAPANTGSLTSSTLSFYRWRSEPGNDAA